LRFCQLVELILGQKCNKVIVLWVILPTLCKDIAQITWYII